MIIIEHNKSNIKMNKKILLGSAGGAPTESVYNSLKIYLGNENLKNEKIIRVDSLTQFINNDLL